MRTQVVEKGPKWSFTSRQQEARRTDETPLSGSTRDEGRWKFSSSPSYSFGGRDKPNARPRPASAPPGGRRERPSSAPPGGRRDYQEIPAAAGAPPPRRPS